LSLPGKHRKKEEVPCPLHGETRRNLREGDLGPPQCGAVQGSTLGKDRGDAENGTRKEGHNLDWKEGFDNKEIH